MTLSEALSIADRLWLPESSNLKQDCGLAARQVAAGAHSTKTVLRIKAALSAWLTTKAETLVKIYGRVLREARPDLPRNATAIIQKHLRERFQEVFEVATSVLNDWKERISVARMMGQVDLMAEREMRIAALEGEVSLIVESQKSPTDMPRRLTVFYSWQSDTPSNLNRNFIEKALVEALARLHSDATLESALRDTKVELDKDTKGVAGSPPIAETILRKVEECAVFIADLTFVGHSKDKLTNSAGKPRQFPNPNVLIEYGYALRCHSHAALVGIMNTAYGKPDAESLPFDLRHLRWPIAYHLTDSSSADKDDQFEKLVVTLENAVGLILSKRIFSPTEVERFLPRKSNQNAAIFYDEAKDLIPENSFGQEMSFIVPEGGKAYLRLYPTVAVPPIETEHDARNLVVEGHLQPMGRVTGYSIERNTLGAIVYESPRDGKLYCFTQLFLSREIWAVDAHFLNAGHQRELREGYGMPASGSYIASGYLEQYFVKALQNFLTFAKTHLQLPQPLRIEAGLVGIKNYGIAVDNSGGRGNALHDATVWQGEADYEGPAWEVLAPFFNKVWANCDVPRTQVRQAELAKLFAGNG